MNPLPLLIIAALAVTVGPPPPEGMAQPEYNEKGHLMTPEGYRQWVYVGSSLGLSYSGDERPVEKQTFHHIYIQPEAFSTYVETGQFPEKTMLVMENYTPGNKDTVDSNGKEEFGTLHGHFEQSRTGVEVALKDHDRFEEGWAYYVVTGRGGTLRDSAKEFPKAACWDCHNDHAADDNVFVQFYPILREERAKKLEEILAESK